MSELTQELPSYYSYFRMFNEMVSSSREYVIPVVLIRNHLMLNELNRKLADLLNPDQNIAVVLGAHHVTHFEYLLKTKLPNLSQRYEIKTNFGCYR